MKREEIRNNIKIRTIPMAAHSEIQTVIGEIRFGEGVRVDTRMPGAMDLAREEIISRIEKSLFNETNEEALELIWELRGDIALECRYARATIFKKLDQLADLISGRVKEPEMEEQP